MSQKYFDMLKQQAALGATPPLGTTGTPSPYPLDSNTGNVGVPSVGQSADGVSAFAPISTSTKSSSSTLHAPQPVLPSMTTAGAVLSHVNNPHQAPSHAPTVPTKLSQISTAASPMNGTPSTDFSPTNSLYVSAPSSAATPMTGTHHPHAHTFSPPSSHQLQAKIPEIVEIDDVTRIQNLFHSYQQTRKLNLPVDDNVYDVVKNYTEALAQSLLEGAAAIARNRGDKTIEKADILLLLAKKLGVELPGDELPPLHHQTLKNTTRPYQDPVLKRQAPKKK